MVVIEMRDAAYNTAFDLLEEAKHSAKKTKLTLCELEDAMYDCYEASKENENEDYEQGEDDSDMNLRSQYSRRYDYRHDKHYGVDEDEDDTMYSNMRRMNRRMVSRRRRDRMGRFA